MRYERWVQHNLSREEGRLPALREFTQSAPVEKTAALSTELRGRAAKGSRGAARLPHCERGANEEASERPQATAPVPVEAITPGAILVSTSDRAPRLARPAGPNSHTNANRFRTTRYANDQSKTALPRT